MRINADLENAASRLSRNLVSPLWEYAIPELIKIIDTEMRNPGIIGIEVRNPDTDSRFSFRVRLNGEIADYPDEGGFQLPSDALSVSGTIEREGDVLG